MIARWGRGHPFERSWGSSSGPRGNSNKALPDSITLLRCNLAHGRRGLAEPPSGFGDNETTRMSAGTGRDGTIQGSVARSVPFAADT